jgi:hypothetical protein
MQFSRRDLFKATTGLAFAGFQKASAREPLVLGQISLTAGPRVTVFEGGLYEITAPAYGWTFGGSVGRDIVRLAVTDGVDSAGTWHEIEFDYEPSRRSAIRLYDGKAIVLFSTHYGQDTINTDRFPSFTTYPQGLFTFTYTGSWAYKFGALSARSPWLFYDSQANAFLVSPADNFMTAAFQFGNDNALEPGIDGRISVLPSGFTHRVILAMDRGINAVFDSWGQTLTQLAGKNRPANDSITLLNKLSYWTDALSAYYYSPSDPSLYVPTLLKLPAEFDRFSTPIASLELDSWHYPKGTPATWNNGESGMDSFQADPSIFPKGLASFQQSLGMPLITHARWIDAKSQLRNKYTISGNVATDPKYWQDYARYMIANGVEVLEQDWLSNMAVTAFNLTDPDAFLGNMAAALKDAGRSIVYCMPLWTHITQSTKYGSVVAARVSNDGFCRDRWDEMLFSSRIVSAVGLWPFVDAFYSKNAKDVLLATLTAGPVGSGDALGTLNSANLTMAVRKDGVIVKPDVPIVPTDATFIAMSRSSVAPMVASTYTDHNGRRTAYVVAYERTNGALSPVAFSPESLGVAGAAYVYDYFQNAGIVLKPGAPFTATVDYSGSYFIVAPIGRSGIAFLGDIGKFTSNGKKRIEELSDDGTVRAVVRFARGENHILLYFHSPVQARVTASAGAVGRVAHVKGQRYRVSVSPDETGTAIISLRAAPELASDVPADQ